MFYVRENLLYVLVNALQERYYGFPNSMSRRLANACALLTKLRKLPDSRRNSGAVLFTTPRDDYQFVIAKIQLAIQGGEQFICGSAFST